MAIYKSSFTRAQMEEALNRALNVVTEGKSFTLKGEWTSGGSYANAASTIDVVIYDGVSYFCRVTHSGRSTNPKADTTYWGQLAGYEPLIKNVPQEDIDESDTIFFTDASDNGSTKRVTLANFTSKFPSGRGIVSIARTSGTGAPGTTDTYTITFTDSTTTAFSVYNGADGVDGDDGREIELQKSATHIQWRYVGGSTWTNLVALSDLVTDIYATINFVIDGGGADIATGIKGDIIVDFPCEIVSATIIADQAGSIVVDIWKNTYANYAPTDADSITASAPPTLTSAIKSQDTTLADWTKTIAAGDVLRFNVDSATTIQRATVSLKVVRTL